MEAISVTERFYPRFNYISLNIGYLQMLGIQHVDKVE